jgi:glutathione synthase
MNTGGWRPAELAEQAGRVDTGGWRPAELAEQAGRVNTVFVVDPLERLDPALDTSIGLMHAAQERGAQVWATDMLQLEAVDGRARCLATPLWLAPSVPAQGCRWTVPDPWYRAGEPVRLWLDEAAAVFVRTEPPLDERYVAATLVLDLVDPARTAMVNTPAGLRACSEHLLPLHFPDLGPATVVSADPATVHAFVAEHRVVVAKPVDGFAGRGVLRLDRHDPNLASLVEIVTGAGSRAAVLQPYLREVSAGNKRVFVLAGEPVGAVHRFPVGGDFRIGDPAAEAPVTDRDREICMRLAPTLRRHGIHLAGLDVIGRHLIEVNVTSVGGLRKADALLGWSLCADVMDLALDGALLAPLLERTPA